MITYNKLVRDNIPAVIARSGQMPRFRTLTDVEFRNALKLKLVEETHEVLTAPTRDDLIEEIADVWEVLNCLYDVLGIDDDLVAKTAAAKRLTRGGFNDRIFLESVDEFSVR